MTARIACFVFLRRSAKNMAAKFKGRAYWPRLELKLIPHSCTPVYSLAEVWVHYGVPKVGVWLKAGLRWLRNTVITTIGDCHLFTVFCSVMLNPSILCPPLNRVPWRLRACLYSVDYGAYGHTSKNVNENKTNNVHNYSSILCKLHISTSECTWQI